MIPKFQLPLNDWNVIRKRSLHLPTMLMLGEPWGKKAHKKLSWRPKITMFEMKCIYIYIQNTIKFWFVKFREGHFFVHCAGWFIWISGFPYWAISCCLFRAAPSIPIPQTTKVLVCQSHQECWFTIQGSFCWTFSFFSCSSTYQTLTNRISELSWYLVEHVHRYFF